MWGDVHFLCFYVTKIVFYPQLWNWQVKTTEKIRNVYFYI